MTYFTNGNHIRDQSSRMAQSSSASAVPKHLNMFWSQQTLEDMYFKWDAGFLKAAAKAMEFLTGTTSSEHVENIKDGGAFLFTWSSHASG